MKIMCHKHYEKVMDYAKEIGDQTLQACLDKLESWETSHPEHPCEIELYYDSAPYSFLFVQRFPNGEVGIRGGLVYHGTPDRSGCVTFDPTKGWQTHT